MTVKYAVIPFQADDTITTPFEQDITESGFGTPSCAIIVLCGDTSRADQSFVTDAKFSTGFISGSNQFAIQTGVDFQDGTKASRQMSTLRCVGMIKTELFEAEATGVLITDGIELTWDAQPTFSYSGFVLLFGDTTDVDAQSGTYSISGGAQSVITLSPAFEPDILFAISTSSQINGASPETMKHGGYRLGVATRDQSSGIWIPGKAVNWGFVDENGAFGSSRAYASLDDDRMTSNIHQSNNHASLFMVSSTASTFTLEAQPNGVAGMYLAIGLSGKRAFAGFYPSGQSVIQGFGFTPKMVLNFSSLMRVFGSSPPVQNGDAGFTGYGAAIDSSPIVQASCGISAQDGVGTSSIHTSSIATTDFIRVNNHDGVIRQRAILQSFDEDGITVNYINAPPLPRFNLIIGLEGDGDSGKINPVSFIADHATYAINHTFQYPELNTVPNILGVSAMSARYHQDLLVTDQSDVYAINHDNEPFVSMVDEGAIYTFVSVSGTSEPLPMIESVVSVYVPGTATDGSTSIIDDSLVYPAQSISGVVSVLSMVDEGTVYTPSSSLTLTSDTLIIADDLIYPVLGIAGTSEPVSEISDDTTYAVQHTTGPIFVQAAMIDQTDLAVASVPVIVGGNELLQQILALTNRIYGRQH